MTRLPVSSLLLASVGLSLSLTAACGDSSGGDNTGGTSGTGPSTGGTAAQAGTPSTSGSAGMGTGGSTGGAGVMGGTAGMPPATGGTGTGGASPMGGSAGTVVGAGMGGTGAGGSPAGGSAGMPPGGDGGTGNTGNCMATGVATQSEKIGTVFNVAVTTDLAGFDGGQIDFGLDTNYGLTAPIDMAAGKTTLLGMKQNSTYHYRVTAKAGTTGMCVGQDQTLETTGLPNGFPKLTATPATTPANAAPEFMIAEFYAGMKQFPFILDKDLDMVWAIDPKFGQPTRARMSIDGKYMWVAKANVPNQTAAMHKIAMDGSTDEDKSSKFTRMNHDFTIVDDANETMYFIAYAASGSCDDIVEYDPKTDMNRTVMNSSMAFGSGACHCNAIQYSPMDDTLIVSDLDHAALFKIDRKTGAVKWVLNGGGDNDFTGDGSTWAGPEHNFHLLGPDHFVLFNNVVGMGSSVHSTSLALEIKLDETAKTATKMWSYGANPSIENAIMGDVQRMANGNTIVAYSTQGKVHEVDAAGAVVRSYVWDAGGAIGYIIMRPTLYGKPPR